MQKKGHQKIEGPIVVVRVGASFRLVPALGESIKLVGLMMMMM